MRRVSGSRLWAATPAPGHCCRALANATGWSGALRRRRSRQPTRSCADSCGIAADSSPASARSASCCCRPCEASLPAPSARCCAAGSASWRSAADSTLAAELGSLGPAAAAAAEAEGGAEHSHRDRSLQTLSWSSGLRRAGQGCRGREVRLQGDARAIKPRRPLPGCQAHGSSGLAGLARLAAARPTCCPHRPPPPAAPGTPGRPPPAQGSRAVSSATRAMLAQQRPGAARRGGAAARGRGPKGQPGTWSAWCARAPPGLDASRPSITACSRSGGTARLSLTSCAGVRGAQWPRGALGGAQRRLCGQRWAPAGGCGGPRSPPTAARDAATSRPSVTALRPARKRRGQRVNRASS
jgi:hypothetical protein